MAVRNPRIEHALGCAPRAAPPIADAWRGRRERGRGSFLLGAAVDPDSDRPLPQTGSGGWHSDTIAVDAGATTTVRRDLADMARHPKLRPGNDEGTGAAPVVDVFSTREPVLDVAVVVAVDMPDAVSLISGATVMSP